MNTVAEFCECILEAEAEAVAVADSSNKQDLLAHAWASEIQASFDRGEPSLTNTEDSSFDSLDLNLSQRSTSSEPTRTLVQFNDRVFVREYDLTVGDHPLGGSLPLSLDWKYQNSELHLSSSAKYRGSFYEPPRRLSIEERRERLMHGSELRPEVSLRILTSEPLRGRGLLRRSISQLSHFLSGFVLDAFIEEDDPVLHDEDDDEHCDECKVSKEEEVFHLESSNSGFALHADDLVDLPEEIQFGQNTRLRRTQSFS